eukprot:scaffold274_cov144-Skeletonema_menzelii.AAC.12
MTSNNVPRSPPSDADDGDTIGSEEYDTLAPPLPEDLLHSLGYQYQYQYPSNKVSAAAHDDDSSSHDSEEQPPPIDTKRRTSHSGRPIFPVRHPTKEDMSQAKKLLT